MFSELFYSIFFHVRVSKDNKKREYSADNKVKKQRSQDSLNDRGSKLEFDANYKQKEH